MEATLRAIAEDMGLKPRTAFSPFYVAVSGSTVSAPVFDLMTLIGREECLARIDAALELTRKLTLKKQDGRCGWQRPPSHGVVIT